MHDELIQQLEFLRDIGVSSLDLRSGRVSDAQPAVASPTSPIGLESIRAEIGDCRRCRLAPSRTNIVFGSGNPNAELVFVGEAPGFDEDQQGLPFVGRAGQLLTKIIESI